MALGTEESMLRSPRIMIAPKTRYSRSARGSGELFVLVRRRRSSSACVSALPQCGPKQFPLIEAPSLISMPARFPPDGLRRVSFRLAALPPSQGLRFPRISSYSSPA